MNINTRGSMLFQTTPGDVQQRRLVARMYPLKNFRGPYFYGMNGLGSTDVSALAASFPRSGGFVPTQYDQFPGIDQGATDFSQQCLDDRTSATIAALIPGAYVVKLPVENLQATNGPVPTCNWIQTPDGVVRAADLYAIGQQACNIYGLSAKCCLEQLLANAVPGGTMGSDCAGGTNPLIAPIGPAFTPSTPVYQTPAAIAATAIPATPVTATPQSSVVNWPTVPTTAQAAPPAAQRPAAPQPAPADNTATTSDNTLLYVGIAAAAAFVLFGMGGKH